MHESTITEFYLRYVSDDTYFGFYRICYEYVEKN